MSVYAYEVQKKLLELGAPPQDKPKLKRAIVVENALAHLRRVNPRRWYAKAAPGRIERFLRLRQEPKPEEIADVATAHALATPKLIEAKCAQTRELAESLRHFVESALVVDPEFHGPQIDAAREIARALGKLLTRP